MSQCVKYPTAAEIASAAIARAMKKMMYAIFAKVSDCWLFALHEQRALHVRLGNHRSLIRDNARILVAFFGDHLVSARAAKSSGLFVAGAPIQVRPRAVDALPLATVGHVS